MATKSAPFSMRLSRQMQTFIDREARRTGRSKGAIVEALAEEALHMRLFPGIAFRGADWERRPWVVGTGLDVWEIVDAHRDLSSIERAAEGGAANERQIRLALDYYEMFPEEIDAAITDNHRPLEQLEEEFPFIAVSRIEV